MDSWLLSLFIFGIIVLIISSILYYICLKDLPDTIEEYNDIWPYLNAALTVNIIGIILVIGLVLFVSEENKEVTMTFSTVIIAAVAVASSLLGFTVCYLLNNVKQQNTLIESVYNKCLMTSLSVVSIIVCTMVLLSKRQEVPEY